MEKKQVKALNSPFSSNGIVYPGHKCSDEFYESIKIVDSVKRVGDGDEDFVVVKKVIVEKQPIKEVINADKDNAGVYAILRQFAKTGDESLLPMEKDPSNVDLVGVPSSLMEMKQTGVDAEKAFKKLPGELTKGMDMKSFVEYMTPDQFETFIKAIVERQAQKGEKVDG